MRASGFMNVQIAERYSNQKRAIVVSIALMERFLAPDPDWWRQGRLLLKMLKHRPIRVQAVLI
jgi:hypothetical protein